MEQFYFSVVMVVYNVEKYIRDALDSLKHQTIGFFHIQLILVDDGSTDSSGKICDEYKKMYPENVLVVHKENGRQSSARNAGLKYSKGKYINFMDPNDTLEKNAMAKVWTFMNAHEEELDVCCIPVYFFGDARGPHSLNNKFEKGTRIIDLMKEENSDCIHMQVNSSFYSKAVANKIFFDTELYVAEDAKVNLSILMDRPVLGVVTGTKYNCRKFGESTIDKSQCVKITYMQHLEHFSNWALDTAKEKFGYVPLFVQFVVMCDLQGKIKKKTIPAGVLTQEEADQYKKCLIDTACRIEDQVILQQKHLPIAYKMYILEKKYACKPGIKRDENDIAFTFGNTIVAYLSNIEVTWEFIEIDSSEHLCKVEGHYRIFELRSEHVRPYLIVNERTIPCRCFDRKEIHQSCLGEDVSFAKGFSAEFSLDNNVSIIKVALCVNGQMINMDNYLYSDFFPVTGVYSNAYANLSGYLLTIEGNALKLSRKHTWLTRDVREFRLLIEIWHKDLLGGRKAVGGRLFYHLVHNFKRRKLWLVSDRITKADDNGEALFRYLMANTPKGTHIFFLINKNSSDYYRMKQVGPCVNAMSFRHKMLHLLCDVNISSQASGTTINPFCSHDDGLRDLLMHQKFVFLQHGIIKDDLSAWLNRYNKNMTGFITAAASERDSIISGDYYYPKETVWLTGLPRYDRLYRKEKQRITLMPTWRRYLMENVDAKPGVWKVTSDFERSDFFTFYNSMLNSERLLTALEKKGYSLQFFPHPIIQPYAQRFHHDPRVTFLPAQMPYRDVYATSNLIITDYSSAVFDFAYLRKPVLYCQFDDIEFFGGSHSYTKGYFSYERDGFGEVTYDLESTIDKIIEYVENGCQLKEVYKDRIERFFAFNDQNNCRRVLDKILALPDRQ